MPGALSDVLTGRRVAALTMEIQRGVVGDLSTIPDLALAASQRGLVSNARRIIEAVRNAGGTVVHCTAGFAPDRSGTPINAPLIAHLLKQPDHLLEGTPAEQLVSELGAVDSDLVSHRRHGVSPFTGTDLHELLSEKSVRTVIASGVAVNLGIIGLCIEAVGLGYDVVLATDAVVGTPSDYEALVKRHTLALVARLASTDDIVAVLRATPRPVD